MCKALWEVTTDKGQKEIIKKECYVFDFALNRALRQISDYSCRLNIHEGNPEKKVAEFINFLPVIAYDGSSMRQINAGDILDIAMAGTSATLLAKRWESVLLVNVDNETLSRLIANKEAMDALMKIEGFRSLNSDIETIIAKSEKVKKAKKEGTKDLTPKQKKELRTRKRVQVQAQADSGKTHQVRHPHSGVHVSDGLPGALPEGCDHPVGAGLVQEGHRSVGEGL